MSEIIQIDGLWWPMADVSAREVILRDCPRDVAALLAHVPGRDLIVQAGGNVGVYPLALAEHFLGVLTWEADQVNFSCLRRNLALGDEGLSIGAFAAAVGEVDGACDTVVVERGNCGAHRVEFRPNGKTKVRPIDSVRPTACDAIWLDIEGAELLALKGAAKTIERFSPAIAVEDKGLHRAFGIEDGALQAWLAERGYAQVDKIGRDKIFKRT